MNVQQQKEALQNSLKHYKFDPKYIVFPSDGRLGKKWAIAEEIEHGGISTLTRFMTYDEFNSYMKGYNDATFKKFSTTI